MCRFLLPLDIILHTPLIVQQRVAAGLGIQWAAAASQQAQPAAAVALSFVLRNMLARGLIETQQPATDWDVPEHLLTTKMLEQCTALEGTTGAQSHLLLRAMHCGKPALFQQAI